MYFIVFVATSVVLVVDVDDDEPGLPKFAL
jgi:hypothetical protein